MSYFFTEAKEDDYISYQNGHLGDKGNKKFAEVLDNLILAKTEISISSQKTK